MFRVKLNLENTCENIKLIKYKGQNAANCKMIKNVIDVID